MAAIAILKAKKIFPIDDTIEPLLKILLALELSLLLLFSHLLLFLLLFELVLALPFLFNDFSLLDCILLSHSHVPMIRMGDCNAQDFNQSISRVRTESLMRNEK